MAQPTRYVRGDSFIEYATDHPAATFPPANLEAELDDVQQTTDELINNIGLIQRDDGKLRNRSVHPDSLSAATLILVSDWNPRGLWATLTVYAAKDVVEQGGRGYVCAVAHISGTFTTDHAAGKWIVLDSSDGSISPFAVATGTGNAMVADLPIIGLSDGYEFRTRAPGANTLTAPTINPAGLGAIAITKAGGAVLSAGDYVAGSEITLRYRLSTNSFELLAPIPTLPIRLSRTVTDSSVTNTSMTITTTDNSPPVGGAGILNPWLAPAIRFDVVSQSGGVTGSTTVLLLRMDRLKGKSTTTFTAPVVGNVAPQTVAVGDSSIFPVNLLPVTGTMGAGQGSAVTENVSITAVPDATHITGIFTKNHASGELVQNGFIGAKHGLGIAMSDDVGNTNDVFGMNPNVTAISPIPGHSVQASEVDVSNLTGVDAAKYNFDMLTGGPNIGGEGILLVGPNKVSYGLTITSDGTCQAWNALTLEGSGVTAIAITNGGSLALAPVAGIRIQSVTTYGIIIGENQTKATNPNYSLSSPTHGIFLTAKGTSGNAASNVITWESLNTSVAHTFALRHQHAAGGFFLDFDGVSTGFFWGTDGTLNMPETIPIQIRGGTNLVKAQFYATGNAVTLTQAGSGVLTITATQLNTTIVAMSGRMRLAQGAVVASANDVTLGADGNYFQISGSTQINRIVNTNWTGGSIVTLKFNAAVTVKHNQAGSGTTRAIILNAAVDLVAAASNTLTLIYDSTDSSWYEIGRKV